MAAGVITAVLYAISGWISPLLHGNPSRYGADPRDSRVDRVAPDAVRHRLPGRVKPEGTTNPKWDASSDLFGARPRFVGADR